MPKATEWPRAEDLTREFVKKVRKQWFIHPHRVAERAQLPTADYMRWEDGKAPAWRNPSVGFLAMVRVGLRQLVAEGALQALEELADVKAAAEARLAHSRNRKELLAAGKRAPKLPNAARAIVPSVDDMRPARFV